MSIVAMQTANNYQEPFETWLASREAAGEGIAWRQWRQQAFSRYLQLGLPTRKDERWKYARLSMISEGRFLPKPAPADTAVVVTTPMEWLRLTLGNAHVVHQSHMPAGITVAQLKTDGTLPAECQKLLEQSRDGLAALSLAFAQQFLLVEVAPGAIIDQPLFIDHLCQGHGQAEHSVIIIRMGSRSGMALMEHLSGNENYWRSQRLFVRLDEAAALTHYRLQNESDASWHHTDLLGDIGQHAHYQQILVANGAGVARFATDLHLSGEQAQAHCHALYMGAENQQLEQSLHLHHDAKNTRSNQHVRGLLSGKSHGIFYGSITVPEQVTNCAAHQQSKVLLLSPESEASNRPELTILNDQVECSHGSAIGSLDEEALYYLQARGIEKAEAMQLMVGGFAAALLEQLPESPARDWLMNHSLALLEKVSRHASRR
ncbi:hypothetical protein GC177_10925 [bacterium]|nr:hypothetical protein [bacterium]